MQANPTRATVVLLGSALAFLALVVPASADAISYWTANASGARMLKPRNETVTLPALTRGRGPEGER